jgi:Late embryogenesis abundant protein.
MKTIKALLLIMIISLGLKSCNTLTQIANQTAELLNLKNCTFDVNGVNNVNMLGLNLSKDMNKEDLNVSQVLKLTNAIMQKSLPVTFNVNMKIDNPNGIAASMAKMDYVIALDGKEVISSSMSNGINVPAHSSSNISIPVSTDLFKLFSGETSESIVNLAFKIAGASSNPVKLSVKVKPYITINNQTLAYPNYITIDKTLQ